ncbi:[protein-PII] uridylyltransferase [Poseidonocella sp. HB161398]|uniref:[protein-PII] uridylyltransferase n=1 Tax=Poseidonocella sp. HB161398 TaxID=2320855 RepID=UPI001F0DC30A|nr:[protein-PII] uridylyltransferase [Poseidonocella sp. HB161398]
MAQPVPDRSLLRIDSYVPPADLILPADEIFDIARIHTALDTLADEAGDNRGIQQGAVEILMLARKGGDNAIAEAIRRAPMQSGRAVRSYAYLMDCIVRTVFEVATRFLHPANSRSQLKGLALMSVGGYGRAEMAPHSDVDLLFLTPSKPSAWAESVIESCLYILWDLRLKVGHSSRSISETISRAKGDITIRTAVLETRYLIGNPELAEQLVEKLRSQLFAKTGPEFVAAKLEERAARHKKQGGQRYVVEPNVKEGKGGLRDLQSLFWIAKYLHGVDDAADLVDLGVFTQDEFDRFDRAERFLMAVRNQLHLIAGRAMDQLTFDQQVEVAERLGYVDRGGRRAVEHFMQDYFRHATTVGELTRIFLTQIEATHVTKTSFIENIRLFGRKPKLTGAFEMEHGRLRHREDADFLADPLNFLRMFEQALETGLLIHPDLMRLVAANLHLIDARMRNDPGANEIFLRLLLEHGNPERALRRMNELGVLGAFIPEFQPVVAMMQFNMYHQYTVDEHTIQCISTLAEIERGELEESLPTASRIMKEGGVNRRVLYLALFFHDIGKGRNEDHAILGARIARKVAPRFGLDEKECETVEWLVRQHLLMSDMAQKRDLSDPRTIRDFARAVQTKRRLDLLLVLTCCDIMGVGPGVWNNWKATLLRRLYKLTEGALATGLEHLNRDALVPEAKERLAELLADWPADKLESELDRHYPPYWQGLATATQAIFATLLDGLGNDEIRLELTADENLDATQCCFAMEDHPGIFARLAGALALVGANVVDARSFTTKDGYATATFWIQDADGHPYGPDRMDRLRAMIHKTLLGEVVAREAIKSRDKIKKRERKFEVPTRITFDNEGSEIYTIIEVDTRDRPGLLFDLSRTFANAHVYIASAQIASYGAQAVDTFYVKDMFGLKIVSPGKQESLSRKLEEAMRKGEMRATE